MATATFRVYEELNEFLPPARRQREFESSCAENATVKQAIEALGVPHTEIEVILVNGVSVGLSHRIQDGDRISVYPMFESLDVRPLLRLRKRPLRDPRFVADAHLGRLARYLRMLGFDTCYQNALTDRELVDLAVAEGRIVLTRDRGLLMHRELTHGIYVRGERPREQLRYVVDRLDLGRSLHPFTRCMRCNGELEEVAHTSLHQELPARVRAQHQRFHRCPDCGRIYWQGSHWVRMQRLIDEVVGQDPG